MLRVPKLSEIEQLSGTVSFPTGYSEFLVIRGCTEICLSSLCLRTMSDSGCNTFCLLNRGSFDSKQLFYVVYLYLSLQHVSALALGHLQVTRYITEETVQCES